MLKKFKIIVAILSVFTLFLLASCGGKKDVLSTDKQSVKLTQKDQTLKLSVKLNNKESDKIVFKSENPSVATVDKTGLLKAVSEGASKITAQYEKLTLNINVEVKFDKPVVREDELNSESVTLTDMNETKKLVVKLGQNVVTDNLVFTAKDSSLINVTNEGVVSAKVAKANHTTQVSITRDGKTVVVDVVIKFDVVLGVALDKIELKTQQDKQLIEVTNKSLPIPFDKNDYPTFVSDSPSILVDKGVVSASAVAKGTITVSYKGQEVKVSVDVLGSNNVSQHEQVVASKSLFITAKTTKTLPADVFFRVDYNTKIDYKLFTYSSSNENIARVNEKTGQVYFTTTKGFVAITATSKTNPKNVGIVYILNQKTEETDESFDVLTQTFTLYGKTGYKKIQNQIVISKNGKNVSPKSYYALGYSFALADGVDSSVFSVSDTGLITVLKDYNSEKTFNIKVIYDQTHRTLDVNYKVSKLSELYIYDHYAIYDDVQEHKLEVRNGGVIVEPNQYQALGLNISLAEGGDKFAKLDLAKGVIVGKKRGQTKLILRAEDQTIQADIIVFTILKFGTKISVHKFGVHDLADFLSLEANGVLATKEQKQANWVNLEILDKHDEKIITFSENNDNWTFNALKNGETRVYYDFDNGASVFGENEFEASFYGKYFDVIVEDYKVLIETKDTYLKGKTYPLVVTANGVPTNVYDIVSYDDQKISIQQAQQQFTALATGSSELVIRYKGEEYKTTINVKDIQVGLASTISVYQKSYPLNITVDGNALTKLTSNDNVTVSDDKILTLDKDNLTVSVIGKGQVNIVVKIGTLELTKAIEITIPRFLIVKVQRQINFGEQTINFLDRAYVEDPFPISLNDTGNEVTDFSKYTFTSTDESVVSVNQGGNISFKKPGNATVTITTKTSPSFTLELPFTVEETLSLSSDEVHPKVNNTITEEIYIMGALLLDNNFTPLQVDNSDDSVATVTVKDGRIDITGHKVGTTVLTLSFLNYKNVVMTIRVQA